MKIQRVQRNSTCSYYVNFPVAVAEAIGAAKGEMWTWTLEDKDTLVFQRLVPRARPAAGQNGNPAARNAADRSA